jgi:hypothetical protein
VNDEGYLRAERALVRSWADGIAREAAQTTQASRMTVAIAWQGNPSYRDDFERSMPLRHFVPVLRRRAKDVVFFSVQKNFGGEQLLDLPDDAPVVDLGSRLDAGADAFVDTAAVLSVVDLVIATDTSVAHLAGALGRRVWLLLPAWAEWRWGEHGDATPWYPRMHLYRQATPGDWQGVVARVDADLAALAAARA